MSPIGRQRSWRRTAAGVGLLMLGISAHAYSLRQAAAAGWHLETVDGGLNAWWLLVLSGSSVVLLIGALLVLSGVMPTARTEAALRLDWYLPFLRKRKSKETLTAPTWSQRAAGLLFPASWLSDRTRGKAGKIRRLFKRIGPTVLSSPWRRAIQGVCLFIFCYLFFYVCWPYGARPATEAASSGGWTFRELDQETGEFRFEGDRAIGLPRQLGQVVFLVEEAASEADREAIGFRLAGTSTEVMALIPQGDLTADQFDAFLLGNRTWTVFEHDPDRWPSHYADELATKERLPAELFLVIDPLVSLSTALAARSWVWSLASAGAILLVCVLIPRGFCGYLCPLGTVIDLFDWLVAGRVTRFRVTGDGWWVHLKYYLLAGTLVAAWCGVLVSGFVAAIPIITRAALFLGEPLQSGLLRGWHQVPAIGAGQVISIVELNRIYSRCCRTSTRC